MPIPLVIELYRIALMISPHCLQHCHCYTLAIIMHCEAQSGTVCWYCICKCSLACTVSYNLASTLISQVKSELQQEAGMLTAHQLQARSLASSLLLCLAAGRSKSGAAVSATDASALETPRRSLSRKLIKYNTNLPDRTRRGALDAFSGR